MFLNILQFINELILHSKSKQIFLANTNKRAVYSVDKLLNENHGSSPFKYLLSRGDVSYFALGMFTTLVFECLFYLLFKDFYISTIELRVFSCSYIHVLPFQIETL